MYTYVNKQKTTMKTSYRESEIWFTYIWITAEDSGYILNLSHSCCFILFPQKKQVLFFFCGLRDWSLVHSHIVIMVVACPQWPTN